jgi:hypothetical protein
LASGRGEAAGAPVQRGEKSLEARRPADALAFAQPLGRAAVLGAFPESGEAREALAGRREVGRRVLAKADQRAGARSRPVLGARPAGRARN